MSANYSGLGSYYRVWMHRKMGLNKVQVVLKMCYLASEVLSISILTLIIIHRVDGQTKNAIINNCIKVR